MKRQIFNSTENITLELLIQKREETEKLARVTQDAIAERLSLLFTTDEETDTPTNSWMNNAGKLFSWMNGIIWATKMIRSIWSFFVKRN